MIRDYCPSEKNILIFFFSFICGFGSLFGLVAAPSPTNLEAGPSEDHHALWFAYADYFSPNAAKSARLFLHQNLIISGQSCNVYKSRRTQTTDWPLSAANCEELANHYLGFNGWNSQLLYHRYWDVIYFSTFINCSRFPAIYAGSNLKAPKATSPR